MDTLDFANWIGTNRYTLNLVFKEYNWSDDAIGGDRPVPNDDTLIGKLWSKHDDIDCIMADNNNEELEWVLNNTFTTEQLYDKFYVEGT